MECQNCGMEVEEFTCDACDCCEDCGCHCEDGE